MRFDSHFKMTKDDVIDFVFENTSIFKNNKALRCEEIGDGNINYVYRISDEASKQSAILKQADVQTRVRPDGFLTPHRAIIEAEALSLYNELAPDFVPKVFAFSPNMACIIMEDINPCIKLRNGLQAGKIYPKLGSLIASFIVQTSLPFSILVLDAPARFKAANKFCNFDMCRITEELVFTHPYKDVRKRNLPFSGNAQWIENRFYNDNRLAVAAAELKALFSSSQQGLIHGDLHSGSIFVQTEQNGSTKIKIIDPEFACFGPIGYDLGNAAAHIIFAYTYALFTHSKGEEKDVFCKYCIESINELFRVFTEESLQYLTSNALPPLYNNTEFIKEYAGSIKKDALRFAGCEINRRIIGSAKTDEITSIKEPAVRIKAERFLANIGCALMLCSIGNEAALTEQLNTACSL